MEFSKTKSVIYSLLLVLIVFGIIEIGVRGYLYLTTLNTNFLLHGLVTDYSNHNNRKDGYFKFYPNKNLHHGTTSHSIPTRINNHGFRGQDFSSVKSVVTRVVAMGGSSTFGYYSRDDYTYPSIMQSYLNDSGKPGESYEVINVGVPHMQTRHIVRLLEDEVLSFQPEVITLYSACNDSWNLYFQYEATAAQKRSRIVSLLILASDKLSRRSLAYHKLNELYKNSDFSTFRHKRKNVDDGLNKAVTFLYTSKKISKEDFDRISTEVRDQYRYNIQQIATLARENDIALLFVKQKYTLNKLRVRGENSALPYASAGTYDEEVRLAGERLDQQGWLWLEEASILQHSMLIESMENLARAGDIPIVDGISALDGNPDYLKSYVHLSEEGNAVLAKVIASGVLALLAGEDSE